MEHGGGERRDKTEHMSCEVLSPSIVLCAGNIIALASPCLGPMHLDAMVHAKAPKAGHVTLGAAQRPLARELGSLD